MEWAKVEYRCPLCKRRFSAISRQIEDRALATERIVSVPVGDQACSFMFISLLVYSVGEEIFLLVS